MSPGVALPGLAALRLNLSIRALRKVAMADSISGLVAPSSDTDSAGTVTRYDTDRRPRPADTDSTRPTVRRRSSAACTWPGANPVPTVNRAMDAGVR